jgi:hypothetical protein
MDGPGRWIGGMGRGAGKCDVVLVEAGRRESGEVRGLLKGWWRRTSR